MQTNSLFTNIADLQPESIQWLWPGHIPLSHLTLIAGDPGVGKSTIVTDIAARTSSGHPWPLPLPLATLPPPPCSTSEPGSTSEPAPAHVIFLAAQENLSATVLPRLNACGANLDNIISASTTPEINTCLAQLDALLTDLENCRLVIFDPIAAYLRQFETSRSEEARAAFASITDLAARHEVAVIATTHQARSRRGPDITHLTSSIALTASARAIWSIKPDPIDPDQLLFLPTKTNLAPNPTGLAFRINSAQNHPEVGHPIWTERQLSTNQPASPRNGRSTSSETSDADQWLLAKLANGPVASGQLKKQATTDGFAWITINRAKARLSIDAKLMPDEFGVLEKWHWQLPQTKKTAAPTPQKPPDKPPTPTLVAPPKSAHTNVIELWEKSPNQSAPNHDSLQKHGIQPLTTKN